MEKMYLGLGLRTALHRIWLQPLNLTRTSGLCLRRSLVTGLVCYLSSCLLATNVHAAFGDLVTSYSTPATCLVMSPTQPYIYATIPSQNSIAIINTNTLAHESVLVGSGPTNLAFSPDGSKAYIANSGSNAVVVFDTQSRTVINSFSISEHPQDVVFANQNRLFVLGESNIFQIDASTGASAGPNVSNVFVYSGSLEISADRNTLYYGQYGLSSSSMYKIDISGATPTLLLHTEPGENGEDLTLSHNGSSICHPNGYPYLIARYRTSDFATLGSFNTGAYPSALCFSPDDSVAYASVHTAGGIQAFDANTFLPRGTITGPEVATKLAVDSTGKYLFAAYSVYYSNFMGIRVYDTGRVTTVIAAPTAKAASNMVSSAFTANWSSIAVATGYRLDVSLSSSFSSYLAGYQDLDVGNVVNYSVSGLIAGTTYYYRVRAYGPPGTSTNSNVISVVTPQPVSPGFGHVAAQYSFPSSSLVMSPTQPYMYATIPSQNSVAIINTSTLAVESMPFVGSGPTNLAFSPDGSKAYIANSSSDFVVVLDTQTRTVINSFLIPEQPQDVVFGNQNRLFVQGTDHIFQIDATTGASTGPSIGDFIVYFGSMEISPDGNTLYYGNYGSSPATLYKFDISAATPALVYQTPFGTVGSNGQDLDLSHDGNFICYATGSGQNGYQIAKFRTSDFATMGSFNTGPYPQTVAFGPDDTVVYAFADTASGISAFDANTFVSTGSITGANAARLAVDYTGRYLFAGNSGGTQVYDTGRGIAVILAPTANAAANVVSSGFTANWSTIGVANGYRLDVSLSNSFSTYLTGYQDRDVGNVTNFSVTGLSAGTTYYYRVRAYGPPGTSTNSNVISVVAAPVVLPGFGHLLAQYNFPSSGLVMSATQPLMYAAVPSQNCVAIINTNTLAVESIPLVGSGPRKLALSPDGSKAYIANSTSNFVVVLDTQTRTVTNSFLIPEEPQDIVFGNQNRLFVLGTANIFQIDATTGASTGPSITGSYVYFGSLEISPDRNTLYYGQYGSSPSRMYKINISGVTPTVITLTPTGDNGKELALSHDGSFICHPNGAPYAIGKYRTTSFTTLGSFDTGPYPEAATFSPDDSVLYASVYSVSGIKVFDANTFVSAGMVSGPDVSSKLAVDSTGRYLFAGYTLYYSNFLGTRVYDTGRAAALGAVSRKNHGASGAFDVSLPLTGTVGIECRAGGATDDYSIVVTFGGSISVTGNPQAQVTAGSATIGSGGASNGGAVSVTDSTVTIPLTNVANAQTINVQLNGLPVGATSTGTMRIPMSILLGDTTGDSVVSASDVADTKLQAGQPVTASNFRQDVNANGSINASDVSLVKSQSATAILPSASR